MTRKGERLVSGAVLSARVASLKKWADENARFHAPEVRSTAEYLIESFRDAIERAGEVYLSTSNAAVMTGWDEQTLRRRGREAVQGERLPREWSALEVIKDGPGYAFRVSTIPVKGRKTA